MPEPEFFTRKVLAVISCCWSGTANFHWLLGYLQYGKAGTLPSACWMWGRCPLAVAGSLLHDLLLADWLSAHPGSPGKQNYPLNSYWLLSEPVSSSFSGIS